MIFAADESQVYIALISLIGTFFTLAFTFAGVVFAGVMTYYMAKLAQQSKDAATEVKAAAVEVNAVKETLKGTTTETTKRLDNIDASVQEVHRTTNGLVAKLEDAAFAKGAKSESDKTKGDGK